MATTASAKASGLFWLIAGLALLWEGIGVASYLGQVYGATEMTAAQQQLVGAMPAWVTGAYAIAVFAGAVGAIGLILRRRWARLFFIVSLIAAMVQFSWTFTAGRALDLLGGGAAVLPIFILLAGAALIWFSSYAARRSWLV